MDNLIAVSSWSVHRTIGISYNDSPATGPQPAKQHSESPQPLLELPAALFSHGYEAMQLCHFHLPSRDTSFADEFKVALMESRVKLLTLLIDEGDISDPIEGDRDAEWIESWVRTAAELGAPRARVIAGKQPCSPDAMNRAVTKLKQIAKTAKEVGVHLETENWFPLLSTPAAVNEFLDRMEGDLSLCADFGNWPRPEIYKTLPQIMPRAETCHAKFEFLTTSELDEPHADKCLQIASDAAYKGPFVLVNGGMGESDWDAMDIQRNKIRRTAGA